MTIFADIGLEMNLFINPILHGLWEIRYHMGGGDQNDPPLSKLIIIANYLCIWN